MKTSKGQPAAKVEGKIAVETFREEGWRLPIPFRTEAPHHVGRARVLHLGDDMGAREVQLSALVTQVLQKLAA